MSQPDISLVELLSHVNRSFCHNTHTFANSVNKKQADSQLASVSIMNDTEPTAAGEDQTALQPKPTPPVLPTQPGNDINPTGANDINRSPLINTKQPRVTPSSLQMKKIAVVLSRAVRAAMSGNQGYTPYNVGINTKMPTPGAAQIPMPIGFQQPQQPQAPQQQPQQPQSPATPTGPSANPINSYGPISMSGDINGNAAFGQKNSPDSLKTAELTWMVPGTDNFQRALETALNLKKWGVGTDKIALDIFYKRATTPAAPATPKPPTSGTPVGNALTGVANKALQTKPGQTALGGAAHLYNNYAPQPMKQFIGKQMPTYIEKTDQPPSSWGNGLTPADIPGSRYTPFQTQGYQHGSYIDSETRVDNDQLTHDRIDRYTPATNFGTPIAQIQYGLGNQHLPGQTFKPGDTATHHTGILNDEIRHDRLLPGSFDTQPTTTQTQTTAPPQIKRSVALDIFHKRSFLGFGKKQPDVFADWAPPAYPKEPAYPAEKDFVNPNYDWTPHDNYDAEANAYSKRLLQYLRDKKYKNVREHIYEPGYNPISFRGPDGKWYETNMPNSADEPVAKPYLLDEFYGPGATPADVYRKGPGLVMVGPEKVALDIFYQRVSRQCV